MERSPPVNSRFSFSHTRRFSNKTRRCHSTGVGPPHQQSTRVSLPTVKRCPGNVITLVFTAVSTSVLFRRVCARFESEAERVQCRLASAFLEKKAPPKRARRVFRLFPEFLIGPTRVQLFDRTGKTLRNTSLTIECCARFTRALIQLKSRTLIDPPRCNGTRPFKQSGENSVRVFSFDVMPETRFGFSIKSRVPIVRRKQLARSQQPFRVALLSVYIHPVSCKQASCLIDSIHFSIW